MVGTWCFHCCGPGSIPGQGTKILQAVQCGQKRKVSSDQIKLIFKDNKDKVSHILGLKLMGERINYSGNFKSLEP